MAKPDFVITAPGEAAEVALAKIPTSALIKVGGANGKALPILRSERWGSSLELVHTDVENVTNELGMLEPDGSISMVLGNHTHKATILDENTLEIDLIFASRPLTNVAVYRINASEDLVFVKQRLTQEQIDQGHVYTRPDAEDSYAVYSSGGLGRGNGKFCHIYRPKLIDANSIEWWCDMDIVNNELRITMPQDALDNAAYPLRLDPVMGYDQVGVMAATMGNWVLSNLFKTDVSGSMGDFWVYLSNAGAGTTGKFGISEAPQALPYDPQGYSYLGQSAEVSLTNGWNQVSALKDMFRLEANKVYAMWFTAGETSIPYFHYDSGVNPLVYRHFYVQSGNNIANELQDPVPITTYQYNDSIAYSLYIDYAASHGACDDSTYVDKYQPDTNLQAEVFCVFGWGPNTDFKEVAYLYWDISDIPQGSTVTKANFSARNISSVGVREEKISRGLRQYGVDIKFNEATWNIPYTGGSWGALGGEQDGVDYTSTNQSGITFTANTQRQCVDVTALIQDAVDAGLGEVILVLHDPASFLNSRDSINDESSGSDALTPLLDIVWEEQKLLNFGRGASRGCSRGMR